MVWNQETSWNQTSMINPQNPGIFGVRVVTSDISHGPWPYGRNVPPHPLWSPRHPHGNGAYYVSTRLKTTILVGRNHPCLALIPLLQLQAQHLEKASKVFFSKVWNSNAWTLDGKNIKVSVEKNKTKMKSFKHFQINWACSLDIRVLHCVGALTPCGFAKLWKSQLWWGNGFSSRGYWSMSNLLQNWC